MILTIGPSASPPPARDLSRLGVRSLHGLRPGGGEQRRLIRDRKRNAIDGDAVPSGLHGHVQSCPEISQVGHGHIQLVISTETRDLALGIGVGGQVEPLVCMFFAKTPFCSKDASSVATWALLRSRASTAVEAVVSTPIWKVAVSGVPSTSPLPVTVIVAPAAAAALWEAVSTVGILADPEAPELLRAAEPSTDPATISAARPRDSDRPGLETVGEHPRFVGGRWPPSPLWGARAGFSDSGRLSALPR